MQLSLSCYHWPQKCIKKIWTQRTKYPLSFFYVYRQPCTLHSVTGCCVSILQIHWHKPISVFLHNTWIWFVRNVCEKKRKKYDQHAPNILYNKIQCLWDINSYATSHFLQYNMHCDFFFIRWSVAKCYLYVHYNFKILYKVCFSAVAWMHVCIFLFRNIVLHFKSSINKFVNRLITFKVYEKNLPKKKRHKILWNERSYSLINSKKN